MNSYKLKIKKNNQSKKLWYSYIKLNILYILFIPLVFVCVYYRFNL